MNDSAMMAPGCPRVSCAVLGLGVFLTVVVPASGGNGVWTSGGPYWGPITTLAIGPTSPTALYAGTYGHGLFKSTDGGGKWHQVWQGETTDFLAIAIDPSTPSTVYAGTSGDGMLTFGRGVFRSTDGGETWNPINTGLTAGNVSALAIHPTNSATVYAGTNQGVFKSMNRGGSWSAVNTGLTNPYVADLAIDASNPMTLYAATAGGVFKSNNGGDGGRR